MILKICGMREAENIQAVEQLNIDWMGFIFYPESPRYVGGMISYLPSQIKRVGVFVNSPYTEIVNRAKEQGLTHLQLHGNESPNDCLTLRNEGYLVIKAISVKSVTDLAQIASYKSCVDYFLFDTKTKLKGGSGEQFDWSILNKYQGDTPFLLSGGIGPDSVIQLETFRHPKLVGYDLNSQFEITPGLKDIIKLSAFVKAIRNKNDKKNLL